MTQYYPSPMERMFGPDGGQYDLGGDAELPGLVDVRADADSLRTDLTTETAARIAADSTEATTRAAADTLLTLASFLTDLTPPQITANTNDYAPTGGSTAHVWRLDLDADHSLTGMTGGAANVVRVLENISTSVLLLKHNVTSTAANRFFMPFSGDQSLDPNAAAIFRYDATSSRWRLLSLVTDYNALVNEDITLNGLITALTTRVTTLEGLILARTYVTTGQQLTSNSTVFQNVTNMRLGLLANQSWQFVAHLTYLSTVAADFKFQWTVPAGAALNFSTLSVVQGGVQVFIGSAGASTSIMADGTAGNVTIVIMGTVVNGGTAGDLQLQAAQNSATVELIDFIVTGTNMVATQVH